MEKWNLQYIYFHMEIYFMKYIYYDALPTDSSHFNQTDGNAVPAVLRWHLRVPHWLRAIPVAQNTGILAKEKLFGVSNLLTFRCHLPIYSTVYPPLELTVMLH